MDIQVFMKDYWEKVAKQDREGLALLFNEDAKIRWHCTNEEFTAEEFIRVNCDYPDEWNGNIERLTIAGEQIITVTRIWSNTASFHVCSFFRFDEDRISQLDEYWGDDGEAPKWRQVMKIGRKIRE